MRVYKAAGFTLIELLIAVAIAGVLLAIAVPSLATIIQDQRLSSVIASIARAAYIARSESAKSGGAVTVCARATDIQCGTDWRNGVLVFRDSSYTSSEIQATRDSDDELLSIVEAYTSSLTVAAIGSADGTASGAFSASYLRFSPDGRSSLNTGTVYVCDHRGNVYARSLQITRSGNVQAARYSGSATDAPVKDFLGRDLSCT